jgi:hypothetical protein
MTPRHFETTCKKGYNTNPKDEFERVHREILELQRAIMDQTGKDRQQISAISYEISRQYGEISRRINIIEGQLDNFAHNNLMKD